MRYCKTPPRSIPVSSPMSGETTGSNSSSTPKVMTASARFNLSWPPLVPNDQPALLITRDCHQIVWIVIATNSMLYRDRARYQGSRRITSLPAVCARPVIRRWVLTWFLLSTTRKCLAIAVSAIMVFWRSVNPHLTRRPTPNATTATIPPAF